MEKQGVWTEPLLDALNPTNLVIEYCLGNDFQCTPGEPLNSPDIYVGEQMKTNQRALAQYSFS
jgi:hypothetical protein